MEFFHVTVAIAMSPVSSVKQSVQTKTRLLLDFVFGSGPKMSMAKNVVSWQPETEIIASGDNLSCLALRMPRSHLPSYMLHWPYGVTDIHFVTCLLILSLLDDQRGLGDVEDIEYVHSVMLAQSSVLCPLSFTFWWRLHLCRMHRQIPDLRDCWKVLDNMVQLPMQS